MTFAAIDGARLKMPSRWDLVRFKRIAALREDPDVDGSARLLSLKNTGELAPRGEDVQPPSDEHRLRYWRVEPGDLVVNPMWLAGGAVGVSLISGAVSPDYRVYTLSTRVNPRFLHHLFRSSAYHDQYRLLMRAETTFDRRVTKEDFADLPVVLPPLNEQREIAGFLDGETARIDMLISAKERMIELLNEQKAARVTTAYNALAEAHRPHQLRHVLRSLRQGWSPECEDRPGLAGEWVVLKTGAVNGGVFRPAEHKVLPSETAPRPEYRVREGDILMSRANGSLDYVGNAALVEREPELPTLYSDKLYKLDLDTARVLKRFVAVMLMANPIREAIRKEISGAEGMANNIPAGVVRRLALPIPSLSRQATIVDELLQRKAVSSHTVSSLEKQIALLRERRHSIMTIAVTGQLDRGSVAA